MEQAIQSNETNPREPFMVQAVGDKAMDIVFLDVRILDDACNLACGYCAPSGFPMRIDREGGAHIPEGWREALPLVPAVKDSLPEKLTVQSFFEVGALVLEKLNENVNADILKLSGGEITLHKGLVGFVENVHEDYTAVQILTNGRNLTDEQIAAYADMGNVFFQVSLDGTTEETNRGRTPNGKITQRVVDNIKKLSEADIPVEINCVLTSHNTGDFALMLEDLKGAKDTIIIPRPVRGEGRRMLDFTPEQLVAFRGAVLDRYDEFAAILPPKVYLERLVSMMELKRRSEPCYVPFTVLGVDNYGNCETCSCGGGLGHTGNIVEDPEEVTTKYESLTNYDPHADHDDCRYCMTQYEIMNLYMEGRISKEEMRKIPTYRYAGVLAKVDKTGDRLRAGGVLKIPQESQD